MNKQDTAEILLERLKSIGAKIENGALPVMRRTINDAIAAAVQAEREACAVIAENDDEDRRGYAQGSISAAIRARSEAKS